MSERNKNDRQSIESNEQSMRKEETPGTNYYLTNLF